MAGMNVDEANAVRQLAFESLLWERIVSVEFDHDGLDSTVITIELSNGTKMVARDWVLTHEPQPSSNSVER